MSDKIYVTEPFLPPIDEYIDKIKDIWQSKQLTNQGHNVIELNSLLKTYLEVDYCEYVANGTLALQLALEALDIRCGDIITTPFTYVATSSAILWQRCNPVFVDIDPLTLCIDCSNIEEKINSNTKGILPVHVFGIPCDVEKISKIALEYNLKTIYDGAHGFGVKYNGKSLLSYGDASICSFHATKLFHTAEGGAVIVNDRKVHEKLRLQMRIGHIGDEHYTLGINAKSSELNAAMGICNFKYIDEIIAKRKSICELYDKLLDKILGRPQIPEGTEWNYSYYPVLFKNEDELLRIFKNLNKHNIYPRRYFFPSINKIKYIDGDCCPVSESVAKRIACLPLSTSLEFTVVNDICDIINQNLKL